MTSCCWRWNGQAAYLFFRDKPFAWEVQQINTVGHPAPPIASAERGSDMWRLFNQTLPFLPASKEFFEEVLWLADGQRAQLRTTADPHSSNRNEAHAVITEIEGDHESPAGKAN
ncbi:unnamed protein product [Phytophthora lilii]|uniref:Unnamed protein product n=1 Tax=Phytophthora lilii TaxID=2077276 RepID=A0A9W6X0D7_9STRA|nr:unnamed protein product [Phytophthora lilii]